MAANAITIPGAEEIEFYFSNGTYADAQVMPILKGKVANELGKLFIKDGVGNLCKLMCDASGSSNTPEKRVFFADDEGQATSDASLTYDGNKLKTKVPTATEAGLPVIYKDGGLESRTEEQFNDDIGKVSTTFRLTTHWRFREINNGESLVLEYSATGEGVWITRREF